MSLEHLQHELAALATRVEQIERPAVPIITHGKVVDLRPPSMGEIARLDRVCRDLQRQVDDLQQILGEAIRKIGYLTDGLIHLAERTDA